MKVEGKVGYIDVDDGTENPLVTENNGALVVTQSGGKYTSAVRAGRVYAAANQAAVALTAAMATTYTGLVLFNPATSTVDMALLQFGFQFTVAVPTATVIGLMTGTVVTAATMDAAAAITPRNRLTGRANASQAIVDNGCTLNGTPVLEQVFAQGGTLATTGTAVGPMTFADIDGSLVIQPGSYVAVYSFAACTASAICSFVWEELPR